MLKVKKDKKKKEKKNQRQTNRRTETTAEMSKGRQLGGVLLLAGLGAASMCVCVRHEFAALHIILPLFARGHQRRGWSSPPFRVLALDSPTVGASRLLATGNTIQSGGKPEIKHTAHQ